MKLFKKHLSKKGQSKLSEKRAAKFFEGRTQPASGAINRFDLKADVVSKDFLIEDKMTSKKSYSFKVNDWRKLSNHAWKNKRMPCFRIEFVDGPTLLMLDEISFNKLVSKVAN